MIFGGMPDCEATMTDITTTATNVAGGRPGQGTIGIVARSAGVMDFWVVGVNGVAGGCMTAGAVSGHGDPAGMGDTGMIVDKGAMTGRAIAATIKTTDGRSVIASGSAHQSTVDTMTGSTGVMCLRVAGDDSAADDRMTACTVAVHTDHGVVVDRGMIIHKGAMANRAIVGGGAGGTFFP